jgi:signal transduction histidine kinase
MKLPFQILGMARRYLIAVWTVGAGLLLSLIAEPLVTPGISPIFLLAVLISAWRGGLGAGLLATFLAAFAGAFVFLPPRFSLSIDRSDMLQLGVFTVCAVMIGTLSAARRRAEAALEILFHKEKKARIEAERANQVKDEFLAAVSHELRTPLTTIKTLTRVMQRRELTEEERALYLADIASECDREIDLVLNLLDLSRIRAGRVELSLQAVELAEVLDACAKIVSGEAEKHDHLVSIEPAPSAIFIRSDPGALRRALCAIIENAIKFTPDHGRICLRSEVEKGEAIVEIEDNGRGIAEADMPHVFEKFYRGQNAGGALRAAPEEVPGIGLGLNLAKNLLAGMGGTIAVESRLGEGAKFIVRLPLWEKIDQLPADEAKILQVPSEGASELGAGQ